MSGSIAPLTHLICISKEEVMKIGIIRTPRLLATLLLAWPALAPAAIPDGVIVFEFTGSNQIYDYSNFYECETVATGGIPQATISASAQPGAPVPSVSPAAWGGPGPSVTLCLGIDMVPDGKGKHTGSATLEFSGAITGTLVGPASGSIKGKAGIAGKAKLKFAATGSLSYGLTTSGSQIKVSCSGGIGPTGFLASLCTVRVKIEGAGSAAAKAEFNGQLNGGTWTLTINVAPVDEKKFAGTGTDSLGYAYAVSGKYSNTSDTSKVKATGIKETASKGAKVQLKELTAGGAAEAKFKVQGYKGNTEVQAAPNPSSGIPNILGTYTGTGTAANTNCTDPDINTTFNTSAVVEVSSQEGPAFSGSITGQLVFEGVTYSGVDYIDGSITKEGMISGTMAGTFEGTSSTGTFTGQLSGNTLTIDSLSHDTAGETCTTIGSLTATR
jgi:hypothetical protein